ncbi:MAG: DUF1295 domain-containing protein [Candidatus Omnitrophica bacterium]|nr:DUF1295 domain-containing protein [Candidatus Omnitrophota bacterium]
MTDIFLVILKGYAILFVMQTILWLIQCKTKDASTADVGWSIGMVVLVVWYALHFDGGRIREMLFLFPLTIWSCRLSFHLISRMARTKEDSRYARFRESWGRQATKNFFLIYQLQPLLNVMLSVPFLIAFLNPSEHIHATEIVGLAFWIIGFSGEIIADQQLKYFLSKPENKGHVCREGLWGYSRHPNFFFEWVMWVAYFIMASASPYGLLGIIAPLVMLFLLIKVTGIPLMEANALKTKGKEFKEYMETTSMFIPFPKRKGILS